MKELFSVELNNIHVAYRSYRERPTTLKESVIKFVKNGKWRYYSTFDALFDVSLKIPKGQVFGIIGSNGAGKSTLLKVIAGVLPPTSGTVKVNGTIDNLIQLGAGFDAELNAIENIYLNSSLHHKTKREIKERIPHILEFAELNEFATTPIKYYSSGMYARLGFSVAVDRDPDILIVDEILAVGDERFQTKCQDVFDRFIAAGKTIVIVSHSTKMLQERAQQIGLLSKGRLIYVGDPETAVSQYRDENYQTALGS
jgi:ABC-type polysaccharide/polyol phosphate transport system ATPase subunit